MLFIKLTDAGPKDDEIGKPIWINMTRIEGMRQDDDGRTVLDITGGVDTFFLVKETPEQILELLRLEDGR